MTETTPPPELEAKIVRALQREGLIRRPRRALLVASAAGLFAAGLTVGLLARGRPAVATGPRYLLLLESTPGADDPARVQSIIAWARGQRAAGRTLSGEKLTDAGWEVTSSGSRRLAEQPLGGYFVVSATDDADALRVAASHPLVGPGSGPGPRTTGRILVRRIDEL